MTDTGPYRMLISQFVAFSAVLLRIVLIISSVLDYFIYLL